MIAYVSFVAATNLILGMALARYLSHTGGHAGHTKKEQQQDSPPSADLPLPIDNELVVNDVIAETAAKVKVEQDASNETDGKAPVDGDMPTLAELWHEFTAQLRDVSERVHYCRAAQDIALAQQAATRLKSFVKEWYAQFEECLQREQPEETSQPAAAGQSLGAVEMFAAQLETTLSNIDALDYTLPCDDVLDLLNRELETLDRQRRGFAKSAEGDN